MNRLSLDYRNTITIAPYAGNAPDVPAAVAGQAVDADDPDGQACPGGGAGPRCQWPGMSAEKPLIVEYHDAEWGGRCTTIAGISGSRCWMPSRPA